MNFRFSFYLILFLVIALICNCTSKEKSTSMDSSERKPVIVYLSKVKKSNIPLKLSDFAESISYIPLDDEPLLGDMKFATLHVVDDTIYVDADNIYKYTPEGKFIMKLFIKGQGPKEAKKYSSSHAAFNNKERYCTFYGGGNTFKSYTFDGQYLGDEMVRDSLDRHI